MIINDFNKNCSNEKIKLRINCNKRQETHVVILKLDKMF